MATAVLPPATSRKRRERVSYAGQEMTIEQFLALPDDRVERWLVDGKVVEWGRMSYRNMDHSYTMSEIAGSLREWCRSRNPAPGRVFSGDAGCILDQANGRSVGVDVALFSMATLSAQTDRRTVISGLPLVAVEVLSPNDTIKKTSEKVQLYLLSGTPLVWVADPFMRAVTVYRPGQGPQLFVKDQDLTCEPELPGFRVGVDSLFLPTGNP